MLYNSAIISWVARLYNIIKSSCDGSSIFAFFRRLASGLARLASGSWFAGAVKREGFFTRVWKYSGLGIVMDGAFNLPSRLLRALYLKTERALTGSLLFKFLMWLLNHLHVVISLFLVAVIVVPQNYWSNTYNMAAALIFLILFYIKTAVKGTRTSFTQLFDVFLALFILSVLLAEVFSIIPSESFRFLLFYLSCFIMMGVLALSIDSKKQLMQVIEVLLVGITISGLYGVWQGITGVAVNAGQIDTRINEGMPGRVFSTMENSNNFAVVLTLLLPFYMAVVLNSKNVLKKLFFIGLSIPCLISLVLTFSRGSWIGFAAGICVILFFKNRKLIPLLILAVILVFPFLPQPIYRRIATIFNPADTSTATRMSIYQTVIPVLKDYWTTGLGLGNDVFRKIIQNYYIFSKMIPAHSHDLFLQIWLETGIVGIISFLGFLAGVFKRSIKAIAGSSDPVISNVLVAGIAAITAVCVAGIADYVWFYPRTMLLFWSVTGIILAALALVSRQSGEEHAPESKEIGQK